MTAPPIPPRLWDRFPPGCRPRQRPRWFGNAGGLSGSDLWRVEAPVGPLVLRRWPPVGPTPPELQRIHGWLAGLRPLAWVATPIAGLDWATWAEVDGRSWELGPLLPGVADLGLPPAPAHLGAMFAALAAVHLRLVAEAVIGCSPGMIARRDEIGRLLAGEFAQFANLLDRATDDQAAPARRWLDLARQTAPAVAPRVRVAADRIVPLQPCIRDVRPDHFLFEGDRLTGLVDFGAMGVDSVATDLARLLGETVGPDEAARRVALGAYEAMRPLAPAERDLIGDFEAANALLGGARWVRWHFVERRRFADPAAVARGFERANRRLAHFTSRR